MLHATSRHLKTHPHPPCNKRPPIEFTLITVQLPYVLLHLFPIQLCKGREEHSALGSNGSYGFVIQVEVERSPLQGGPQVAAAIQLRRHGGYTLQLHSGVRVRNGTDFPLTVGWRLSDGRTDTIQVFTTEFLVSIWLPREACADVVGIYPA